MDQRRYILFVLASTAFFLVWLQVAPRLFPDLFPKPEPQDPVAEQVEEENDPAPKPDNAEAVAGDAEPEKEEERVVKRATFPRKSVRLGEGGFAAGYFLDVELSSQGAAIESVALTDPRYTTLDRTAPLKVVGNSPIAGEPALQAPRTFETAVAYIDNLLREEKLSLNKVHWEVVQQTPEAVTFRYPSPDGQLAVQKTFRIEKGDLEHVDESAGGYLLHIEFDVINESETAIKTAYTLQGPVGLPLENAENTRLFREVKIGTLENQTDEHDVTAITMRAAEVVEQYDDARKREEPIDTWRDPLRYAGVDVQFFAALLFPRDPQVPGQGAPEQSPAYFELARPTLLYEDKKHTDWSDVSLVLESRPLTIPAGETVTHSFDMFLGPKRPALLTDLDAESIIQLGWFASISKAMLATLNFFHQVISVPYALAIILLTVVVKLLLFPVTRHQIVEGEKTREKMAAITPRLKELQEKYRNEPEKYLREQQALYAKHDIKPTAMLGGCLPALLQLPIFWGLYNSLYQAVDLRLARFLWIDNLAAPDSLFEFGFTIPIVNWTEFNLLPLLTVGLFITQQRIFAPPPQSEEQEMTYRMMNFMMLFMGFLFYRVPAGLCLYFIASSVWGLCERQVLKANQKKKEESAEAQAVASPEPARKTTETDEPRRPGWFERLLEAADQAKNATESQRSSRSSTPKKSKKAKPRRR